MDLNDELLASLKEGDISEIRATLIGCRDEDLSNSGEPQTLAMANDLAEKMNGKLFEADNGHFDFNSPMTKETLRSVKSRLRMNFSFEKLEFATKIIAELKGGTAVVSSATAQENTANKTAETVSAASVVASTAASTSEQARETQPKVVSTQPQVSSLQEESKTTNERTVASTSNPAESSIRKESSATEMPAASEPKNSVHNDLGALEMPEAPEPAKPELSGKFSKEFSETANATETSGPSAKREIPPSKEEPAHKATASDQSSQQKATPGQTTSKDDSTRKTPKTSESQGSQAPRAPHVTNKCQPRFFEKLFGSVGRVLDDLFERLRG